MKKEDVDPEKNDVWLCMSSFDYKYCKIENSDDCVIPNIPSMPGILGISVPPLLVF